MPPTTRTLPREPLDSDIVSDEGTGDDDGEGFGGVVWRSIRDSGVSLMVN